MPGTSFIRRAVVILPVSPTSASEKRSIPANVREIFRTTPDLVCQFWNPNPFDCGLEGTAMNGTAMPTTLIEVTPTSGYPVPARTKDGLYVSKRPIWLSAAAYPTPEQTADLGPDFDYTGRVLWVIYGSRQ